MLQKTPLADLHVALGAKLVDFAGWAMPVNYGSQIQEHHAVRKACGIFDVSHMTIVDVSGAQAQVYLRYLLANDVAKLSRSGQALYSAMLNERGGVVDDLIVYCNADEYRVVVNSGTREKDLAWMQKIAAGFEVTLAERDDLAMLAIQGPGALALAAQVLDEDLNPLKRFYGQKIICEGSEGYIGRTGYTGEDGVEVMVPNALAEKVWRRCNELGAQSCGLGARDTLRLEAGMNLYGHEMNDSVSPLVANMGWTIDWSERDFVGKVALEGEKAAGVKEKLVGLVLESRGVMREGYVVLAQEGELGEGERAEGIITSGSFSPTLDCSIALARVPSYFKIEAQVVMRGKKHPVKIVKPCFVRNGKAVK